MMQYQIEMKEFVEFLTFFIFLIIFDQLDFYGSYSLI